MSALAAASLPSSFRWLAGIAALATFAWALAILPLPITAGLVLTGAAVLLALRHPWLVWLLLAAAVSVTSAAKLGAATATEMLLAVAIPLAFAQGAARRSLRIEYPSFLPALVVYVLVLILAALDALDLAEAAAEIIKWVEFGLVVALVPLMLPSSRVPWLIAALLVGAGMQAALGVYQYVFAIGPEWFALPGGYMRASGVFRQPNPYAGYLGLTLPVAVSLALWSWARLLRVGHAHLSMLGLAAALTAVTALIAVGILVSWSRGAWLGVVLSLVVVMAFRSRTAATLAALAGVASAAVAAVAGLGMQWLPASIAGRLQEVPAFLGLAGVLNQPVTDENYAVVERVAHWVAALRMWEGSPWLGVGPGSYAAAYPLVHLPRWQDALGHAHNIYLNVLAESGVIGLTAFAALWVSVVIWLAHLLRCPVAADAPWSHALVLGVLGTLTYLATHSLFDNLLVQGIYLQVAFWLAVVAGTDHGSQSGGSCQSGK